MQCKPRTAESKLNKFHSWSEYKLLFNYALKIRLCMQTFKSNFPEHSTKYIQLQLKRISLTECKDTWVSRVYMNNHRGFPPLLLISLFHMMAGCTTWVLILNTSFLFVSSIKTVDQKAVEHSKCLRQYFVDTTNIRKACS